MNRVEQAATQYADECNSCYSNDYDGFVAGAEWGALEFSEWMYIHAVPHLNKPGYFYCDIDMYSEMRDRKQLFELFKTIPHARPDKSN